MRAENHKEARSDTSRKERERESSEKLNWGIWIEESFARKYTKKVFPFPNYKNTHTEERENPLFFEEARCAHIAQTQSRKIFTEFIQMPKSLF